MADVSAWNFAPDGAFLLGPIVGRLTSNSARILIESAQDTTAVVTAAVSSGEGEAVFSKEQKVSSKKPVAFEVTGLSPGKRFQVTVKLGSEERTASFTTPAPERKTWNVGLVSCNKISVMAELGMWEVLAKEASTLDAILHMGDQVYGDEEFHRAKASKKGQDVDANEQAQQGCWGKSRALCVAAGGNLAPLRPQIKEIYASLYRATWSHPATAATLASVSNLMVLDDHEITDDTGDVPEHLDPNTWQFFVMKCAYEVYLSYQAQLNGTVEDVNDWERTTYWHTELFPGVGVFFLDVRLERSLHLKQQEGADWTDHHYLGPRQWDDLVTAMNKTYKDCRTMIVVSPTPLLFVSSLAASAIAHASDDVIGSWANDKFKTEQRAFLELMSDWQADKPNRAVAMVAGDIHIGGFADVQLDSGGPVINQITASAIGNLPEASVGALNLVGAPILSLADSHLTMRVRHDKWIFEPNYGVMTIGAAPGSGPDPQRPKISAKLVSKAKTITDEFTYTHQNCIAGCPGLQCNIS